MLQTVPEPVWWLGGLSAVIQSVGLVFLFKATFKAGEAHQRLDGHDRRLNEMEDKQGTLEEKLQENSEVIAGLTSTIAGQSNTFSAKIDNLDRHLTSMHESLHDLRKDAMKQGGELNVAMASAVRSISELATALAKKT